MDFKDQEDKCYVPAWCKPSSTQRVVFNGLVGPNIAFTFVSSSNLDTFPKMKKLVRDAFIEAFSPDNLLEMGEEENGWLVDSKGITVKTRGYSDSYQCCFTKDFEDFPSPYIRRVIYQPSDWDKLSDDCKTLTLACEFDECVKDVIFKNKTQLSQ